MTLHNIQCTDSCRFLCVCVCVCVCEKGKMIFSRKHVCSGYCPLCAFQSNFDLIHSRSAFRSMGGFVSDPPLKELGLQFSLCSQVDLQSFAVLTHTPQLVTKEMESVRLMHELGHDTRSLRVSPLTQSLQQLSDGDIRRDKYLEHMVRSLRNIKLDHDVKLLMLWQHKPFCEPPIHADDADDVTRCDEGKAIFVNPAHISHRIQPATPLPSPQYGAHDKSWVKKLPKTNWNVKYPESDLATFDVIWTSLVNILSDGSNVVNGLLPPSTGKSNGESIFVRFNVGNWGDNHEHFHAYVSRALFVGDAGTDRTIKIPLPSSCAMPVPTEIERLSAIGEGSVDDRCVVKNFYELMENSHKRVEALGETMPCVNFLVVIQKLDILKENGGGAVQFEFSGKLVNAYVTVGK